MTDREITLAPVSLWAVFGPALRIATKIAAWYVLLTCVSHAVVIFWWSAPSQAMSDASSVLKAPLLGVLGNIVLFAIALFACGPVSLATLALWLAAGTFLRICKAPWWTVALAGVPCAVYVSFAAHALGWKAPLFVS